MRGVRSIRIGTVVFEEVADGETASTAVRRVDDAAVETAATLSNTAKAGDQFDLGATRKIIDTLAKLVSEDRASLMAPIALTKYDVEALDPQALDIHPLAYK